MFLPILLQVSDDMISTLIKLNSPACTVVTSFFVSFNRHCFPVPSDPAVRHSSSSRFDFIMAPDPPLRPLLPVLHPPSHPLLPVPLLIVVASHLDPHRPVASTPQTHLPQSPMRMVSLLRQSTVTTQQIGDNTADRHPPAPPHHTCLQLMTNADPDAATTVFRVSCHSGEATAPGNPAFSVAYDVALKDLHINPNFRLSICIFLTTRLCITCTRAVPVTPPQILWSCGTGSTSHK
jgi:hypothetical protein